MQCIELNLKRMGLHIMAHNMQALIPMAHLLMICRTSGSTLEKLQRCQARTSKIQLLGRPGARR